MEGADTAAAAVWTGATATRPAGPYRRLAAGVITAQQQQRKQQQHIKQRNTTTTQHNSLDLLTH
jgi:hypothetical protein